MKKGTKKFLKGLRKQTEAASAGTRYTIDAKSGDITKDEPKKKGAKEDAKQETKQA